MAVQFQDYYESLGVARTAAPEEIKQAFRNLARIHHPDVARNKVTGEARFKEINEAYEVLSDPSKRQRYDKLGANWQGDRPEAGQPAPGGGRRRPPPAGPEFEFDGTGFSDFFSSFFGGGHSGFSSHRFPAGATDPDEPAFGPASRDLEADLLVTLEEALRGSLRKVTLRRSGPNGGEERTNTYQVRLPPGVREGQRIRLAGQGGTRLAGGPAGDLYLRIRLARHPDFKVEASDLHCDLDVAPWEAVLGVQVQLPALDGPTSLRVPPGTGAGRQLRLRGLGLPNREGTRGDLYATVKIQVPATVTPEERTLWEKLAAVSQFRPRNET